jgi:hypothetical protein
MQTDAEEVRVPSDFVLLPSGEQVDLYTADQVRASATGGENDLLLEIVDWAENFLGRPHPRLGRSGNVCPFVPESMMRGALKFSVLRLKNRGTAAVSEIEGIVATFRDHFLENEKVKGKIDYFGAYVMIYPDVTFAEAPHVIDPSQRKLKPSFVKEGLMLGEFHPLTETPGLRNNAFRPLRSPIPLLAIRHMVESDIDFLTQPSDPAATRVRSIKAYLQFLGSSMSVASQIKAKEALKLAEAEASAASARA